MTGLAKYAGYFDAPGQEKPAFDPAVCVICEQPTGDQPRLCRSLMLVNGERSYFFSYHTACRDDAALDRIEGELVDEIAAWERPQ